MEDRIYLCIDLKTFYASVECRERNLDPMHTNLVVANPKNGKGAICLAITPALKTMGIKNRSRLFEIPEHVDYITAMPRMKLYIEYSANIYAVYLKYIAKEDIHVYSIDECFLDITKYLQLYQLTPKQLARKIMDDVFSTTGILASVGIGSNLYLAKIALDIKAKHTKEQMSYLDESLFQETLWHHTPITDFWQFGRGIAKRLEKYQIYTMYDVAHAPAKLLYQELGINADYLIDYAWGREPIFISDIKAYKPKSNSISSNQILQSDYYYQDALLIVKEMVEVKCLDLVDQHLVTNTISLSIGYSKEVIKPTGGSMKIDEMTNSYRILLNYFIHLFTKTTNKQYPIRRVTIGFNNVKDEIYESYDLFTDTKELQKEKQVQLALLKIKKKYGKNAVVKGMNLQKKATTRKRNTLIGGHNSE